VKKLNTDKMKKITLLMLIAFANSFNVLIWDLNAQQTPELIKNINELSLSSSPDLLTLIDHKLFFIATTKTQGRELWVSDGATEGTRLVKDISPGADPNPLIGAYGSGISDITELNGVAYFIVQGVSLYKSDGTEGGTQEVAAFAGSSQPDVNRLMTNVNGTLYFLNGTTSNASELWKSDGTKEGTVFLHTINETYYYSNGGKFEVTKTIALNDLLIFVADDGVDNHEMWVSNGSKEGTFKLKEIRAGSEGSDPQYLTEFNGFIYFTANDGIHGYELWKTDGTPEGTELVIDIEPGSSSGYPSNITNVNGNLYFSASDGTYYNQPWKSDGTAKGTGMIKIGDNSVDFIPKNFVNLKGKVLFSVSGGGSYTDGLWILNSKEDNTAELVKAIRKPDEIVSDGTTAFFRADGGGGYELWKTNGTEFTTVRMKDIFPGVSNSNPNKLTLTGNGVIFSANDGVHGFELWRSNLFAEGEALSIIKNDINKNNILVYPNPAKKEIYIQLPNQEIPDKIRIINSIGLVVLEQAEKGNTVQIENLANGTYIIEAISGDKKRISKFLKN
jgi:trimeric autotransporter adhesin